MSQVTNKELLPEIHKCKNTYCVFLAPEHANYDLIVHDLKEATEAPEGTIIRHMTHSHIPLDPNRTRRGKQSNTDRAWTPFPPFRHYQVQSGELVEVGRSHWSGDLETGHFDPNRGRLTPRMGRLIMLLVERHSRRANWNGYSYLDEMKSNAMVQLSQVALQFNEAKGSNPFAFYWTTIARCFTRVFNDERKVQTIRDDLLWSAGASPSNTQQTEWEFRRMGLAEPASLPRKIGRPKAMRLRLT